MDIKEAIKIIKEVEKWFEDSEFLENIRNTTDIFKTINQLKQKDQSIQKQVGLKLGITESNMSRKLKYLKDNGLVKIASQQWYKTMDDIKKSDVKAQLLELTEKGKKVLFYIENVPLSEKETDNNKIKKTKEVPKYALEFHSEKLKEFIERFVNKFPIIETDGIYTKSKIYVNKRYDGGELIIEGKEELYQDFLENHIEFITYKDFNSLITQFKEISKEWWQASDTVIKGIILDLENHLGLPYSYRDDKSKGFTINLVEWVLEAIKCYIDSDCREYYFKKYFVEKKNNEVVKVKRGEVVILEYRNERGCLIFEINENLNKEDLKEKHDKQLLQYMQNLNDKPYFSIYQDKLEILYKAQNLRNEIITILKKNLQIPLYRIGNCPYLKLIHPDIPKEK